jgi:hypothetical protein
MSGPKMHHPIHTIKLRSKELHLDSPSSGGRLSGLLMNLMARVLANEFVAYRRKEYDAYVTSDRYSACKCSGTKLRPPKQWNYLIMDILTLSNF